MVQSPLCDKLNGSNTEAPSRHESQSDRECEALEEQVHKELATLQDVIDGHEAVSEMLMNQALRLRAQQHRVKRLAENVRVMRRSHTRDPDRRARSAARSLAISRARTVALRHRADLLQGRIPVHGCCEVTVFSPGGCITLSGEMSRTHQLALAFGLSQLEGSREARERPLWSTAYLPDEVLQMIFRYLDPNSLVSAGQVCQRWRRLALHQSMWNYRSVSDSHWRTLARVCTAAPCLKSIDLANTCRSKLSDHRPLKEVILSCSCKVSVLVLCTDRRSSSDHGWAIGVLRKYSTMLQELFLEKASRPALEIAFGIRSLRGLYTSGFDSAIGGGNQYLFTAPPPELSSLQWLNTDLPYATGYTLLSAHQPTLRRATVIADLPASPDPAADKLLGVVSTLPFPKLTSLRLMRNPDSHVVPHCQRQLRRVRRYLSRAHVVCGLCRDGAGA